MKLLQGDCMELLPDLPDNSVDLVLADLPYGTTECKWDHVLPMDALWKEYKRILKTNGVAALFCAQPFTTALINSNRADFRYCWYWVKNMATGFAFARYQPMRKLEEVAVFVCNVPGKDNTGRHQALRDYMLEELKASGQTRGGINRFLGNSMASHYFTHGSQFVIPTREQWAKLQAETGRFSRPWESVREEYQKELGPHGGGPQIYNPQGLRLLDRPIIKRGKKKQDTIYGPEGLAADYEQKYTGYPVNVLYFNTERGLHPTQKPVPLLEYLVRTYTNEGGTVLDNCMGSGSTGAACLRSGRHFIGIEKDPQYFRAARERLEKEAAQVAGQ